MELIGRFQQYVTETLGLGLQDKVLLAVSGGRDSMLMSSLFLQAGYTCIMAHCNFHLRELDADLDEALVRDFASAHGVPFFVQHFDTHQHAKAQGISTQMAARELRYSWFETLRKQEGAQWIAIAQHQDDHIETVLLNLSRGTGLQGMQGILPRRGRIIRPLLFLTSQAVTNYVQQHDIPYRDDQSNFSTKYQRNKIRLDIVPKFRELNPDFNQIMCENITHFQEAYRLLQSFVEPIRQALFEAQEEGMFRIRKVALQPYLAQLPLLFELFKPYGFAKPVLADVQMNWQGDPGKLFHAPAYELLLDREDLWLKPRRQQKSVETVEVWADSSSIQIGVYRLAVKLTHQTTILRDERILQVDFERLQFPLTLRFWQEGDYFYPLGMGGKRKKLSDYFIQQKVDRYAKQRVPILVNGNGEVIWVLGHRADNRYRITESTKKVFTLVSK